MSRNGSHGSAIRAHRLELAYTAARLNALEGTRHLAGDFEEAVDKFAMLEAESARIDLMRVETQAMVETADDAWDDTMHAFQRRLLDLSGNSTDHAMYRRYFADIPSQVTSMSYAAEILISKDLETDLGNEDNPELAEYAERLADKRRPLESALRERTRLEVEAAKFGNRVALAVALTDKLRRVAAANLEEIGAARDHDSNWSSRFFLDDNPLLDVIDGDGVGNVPAPAHAFQAASDAMSED